MKKKNRMTMTGINILKSQAEYIPDLIYILLRNIKKNHKPNKK